MAVTCQIQEPFSLGLWLHLSSSCISIGRIKFYGAHTVSIVSKHTLPEFQTVWLIYLWQIYSLLHNSEPNSTFLYLLLKEINLQKEICCNIKVLGKTFFSPILTTKVITTFSYFILTIFSLLNILCNTLKVHL